MTRVRGKTLGPHFSHSQLRTYQICAMKYFWRYVKGIREPNSSVFALGRSIHTSIEHDYRKKIDTGKNVALSMKTDLFVSSFREEVEQGVLFADWEKPESVEKQGLELVKLHHTEVAVTAIPLEVERFIELDVSGIDVPVVGWVDAIEEVNSGKLIKDHKTSARKFTDDAATFDLQLALYSAALDIRNVGFDVMVKTKTPSIQQLAGKITPLFRSYALGIFRQVYECIDRGIFYPQAPGKWPCSPDWCYFWDRCVKRFGK